MHTPNQTTTPGADGQSRVGRAMDELQDKVGEEAKAQSRAKLDEYRERGADELQNAAAGMRAAASELDRRGDTFLSQYVGDFAGSMVSLAENLRGKSADELIQQASRLARENPTLFIAGSIAVGFGLTRFARASGRRAAEEAPRSHADMGGTGGLAAGQVTPGASAYGAAASDFANASSHLPGQGDGTTTSGGHH